MTRYTLMNKDGKYMDFNFYFTIEEIEKAYIYTSIDFVKNVREQVIKKELGIKIVEINYEVKSIKIIE